MSAGTLLAEPSLTPISLLTQRFDYDAWGSVVRERMGQLDGMSPTYTNISGGFSSGPRYRGMWYDGGADGLYKTATRFYDPKLGQFTQEDPARAGSNWYAYCGGDPVNRSDPSGLDWEYIRPQPIIGADDRPYIVGYEPGYWSYKEGTDPTVPKPNDSLTPADVGLDPGDNVFTWVDYNREKSKPRIERLFRWWGYGQLDAYHFDQFEFSGIHGQTIEYGPRWARKTLDVPAIVAVQDALRARNIALLTTVIDTTLNVNPGVFLTDRGTAVVAGSSPLRVESNQIGRLQAGLDLAAAGGGTFLGYRGMVSLDNTAGRMAGMGPMSRPLSMQPASVKLGSERMKERKYGYPLYSGVYDPKTNALYLDGTFGHMDGAMAAGISPSIPSQVGISIVIRENTVYWASDSGSFTVRYPTQPEVGAIEAGLAAQFPGHTVKRLNRAYDIVPREAPQKVGTP